MMTSIRFDSLISSISPPSTNSFIDVLSTATAQRIKDIAIHIFTRLSAFLNAFSRQSNESNLKGFALISCLSLIALLVISLLRQRDSPIIPLPTPRARPLMT